MSKLMLKRTRTRDTTTPVRRSQHDEPRSMSVGVQRDATGFDTSASHPCRALECACTAHWYRLRYGYFLELLTQEM
jgi:hypothetical protein